MDTQGTRKKCRLEGPRIHLRDLVPEDAGPTYLKWMGDPEVTRYTESRFSQPTPATLREFVIKTVADPSNVFLAITLKDTKRHIGNIKLGPIQTYHRFGDIGLIIGEKDCWGKGYAAEAIALLRDYAFGELKLHKLTASCYANNPGSLKAFLKAGFFQEGSRKSQYRFEEEYVDLIQMGCLNAAT